MVLVTALRTYCYAACHCPREKEDEIAARVQKWNVMVAGIKEPGTELNQGGIHFFCGTVCVRACK